ncbi:MAG: alternative ribosome rescue aminoacyl-tRNA hydrolase ArfB [Polyangiaceae bacterium]
MLPLIILSNALELKPEYLTFTCERSSGPGGQNVNKVSSKVRLRFDFGTCDALDAATQERLRQRYARRLDANGALVITSQVTRDQRKNLHDAIERLKSIVNAALVPEIPRKPTKPSRAAKARRLSDKRQQSVKKSFRRGTRENVD